ncbi:MAG: winged helix-turn-helix domain-containing protein [Eubacteriales bacterium]|nr:winged helix-turn-helix domain-containing protein [Eubacteriales bacterium]
MERDYGAEIDGLQKDLQEIKELLVKGVSINLRNGMPQMNETNKRVGHIEKMTNMHPDPAVMAILDKLENLCGSNGDNGRITYLGVFASGNRQSTWIRNEVNTNDLLSLIENKTAEKVLACIGNNDRLNILLAILKKPMTVAQLVEECGYNSTGQVYHHLKPLTAADLITEDNSRGKGYYVIQPHRVQGIIMLLAGISDMVDPQYSQGNWAEEAAD